MLFRSTVLFVIAVKGQLVKYIDNCRNPENYNAFRTSEYINGYAKESFYETGTDFTFDLIRSPIPYNAGYFSMEAILNPKRQAKSEPSKIDFIDNKGESIVRIIFDKNKINENNGWDYISGDNDYKIYSTILKIIYRNCDCYTPVKTFSFTLKIHQPLNKSNKSKVSAESL